MAEITNQLLKDAIADAEAVKQTAIANAKQQLEEAFAPAFKQIIAKRLKSEADADKKLEAEMQAAISQGGGMEQEALGMEPDDFAAVDHEDTVNIPTGKVRTEKMATSNIGPQDNAAPSPEASSSTDDNSVMPNFKKEGEVDIDIDSDDDDEEGEESPFAGGDDAKASDEPADDESDDELSDFDDLDEFDLDLDEIIKELEDDIAALTQLRDKDGASDDDAEEVPAEDGDEEEETEPVAESVPNKSSAIAGADNKSPSEFTSSNIGSSAPDNKGGPGDGSDLEKAGSAVKTYEASEDVKDSEELGAANKPGKNVGKGFVGSSVAEGSTIAEDEEFNLQEIIEEIEAAEATPQKMASKIADLRAELAEYREAVGFLRGKLNEVNLLNAKLLFTNKLFRISGLGNGQKVRIVETFDRATTVREVKLIYSTLAETLVAASRTSVPSRKKVTVTEGLASKPVASTAPKAEIITEAARTAHRLQELAGLLK